MALTLLSEVVGVDAAVATAAAEVRLLRTLLHVVGSYLLASPVVADAALQMEFLQLAKQLNPSS